MHGYSGTYLNGVNPEIPFDKYQVSLRLDAVPREPAKERAEFQNSRFVSVVSFVRINQSINRANDRVSINSRLTLLCLTLPLCL